MLFGHRYLPSYEVQSVRTKRGNRQPYKYDHREFRFTCSCCETKTKWQRMRRLDDFIRIHNVSW